MFDAAMQAQRAVAKYSSTIVASILMAGGAFDGVGFGTPSTGERLRGTDHGNGSQQFLLAPEKTKTDKAGELLQKESGRSVGLQIYSGLTFSRVTRD